MGCSLCLAGMISSTAFLNRLKLLLNLKTRFSRRHQFGMTISFRVPGSTNFRTRLYNTSPYERHWICEVDSSYPAKSFTISNQWTFPPWSSFPGASPRELLDRYDSFSFRFDQFRNLGSSPGSDHFDFLFCSRGSTGAFWKLLAIG